MAATPSRNLGQALDALSSAGKRVKVHDAQMVVKLPQGVKSLVEEYAKTDGVSSGTIVRYALAEYFERRGVTG